MSHDVFPVWKETPFLRLTLPLMLGILIQWNIQLWIWIGWMVFLIILLLFLRFSINDPFVQFKYYCIYGVFVNLLVVCLGILLCARQDYRNRAACILNSYAQGDWVIARLVDDPIEKSHSYKTLATVKYIRKNGEWLSVEGSIFIYTERKIVQRP
jgi:competence protein ComEC